MHHGWNVGGGVGGSIGVMIITCSRIECQPFASSRRRYEADYLKRQHLTAFRHPAEKELPNSPPLLNITNPPTP